MADNPELESFRRKWREEVAGRSKPRTTPPSVARDPHPTRFPLRHHEASHRKDLEEEGPSPGSFDPEELAQQVGELTVEPKEEHEEDGFTRTDHHEPRSALEHFERAVEKEAAGNLGDSLQHYRRAYRLDASVDKSYRNKHYAHVWKKPTQPAPGAEDVPATTAAPVEIKNIPTNELIESFAQLPIPQAEPLVENTPPPPCPIAKMPSEVISEILRYVALQDPATFGRVALVCKRLAYHFAHEQPIWRAVCQSPKFGFAGMHYTFACDIHGLPIYTLDGSRYTPFPEGVPLEIPKPLLPWSQVFQSFPRIRFSGIYISTVNYTRDGAQSSYQTVSWNSPIHIVTYYRYLRFYPDGSIVSLLSTTEPVDVVPHINKENMMAARAISHKQHQRQLAEQGQSLSGATDPVPAAAMNALRHAHRGRWCLTSPVARSEDSPEEQNPAAGLRGPEESSDSRDLIIETEGVEPKYVNIMHLSLRSPSASKSHVNPSKNTKLIWRGYWGHNTLTDDWGEFGLRNDRAFVFRRVRGWGLD
ncbi:hypothetical protein N7490_000208 [Penicillium lividum]|nr:hypothetical protein N7490_000208 [Penicillium lividum]